jgi:hypothetical protein
MSVRVVIVEALGGLLENGCSIFAEGGWGVLGEVAEAGIELLLRGRQALKEVCWRGGWLIWSRHDLGRF